MAYYGGGSNTVIMMGGIRRGGGLGGRKPDPNKEPSGWILVVMFVLFLLAIIFLSCYNF